MERIQDFEAVLTDAIQQGVTFLRVTDISNDALKYGSRRWRKFVCSDECLTGQAMKWAAAHCDLQGCASVLSGRCRRPERWGASMVKAALYPNHDGMDCVFNISGPKR